MQDKQLRGSHDNSRVFGNSGQHSVSIVKGVLRGLVYTLKQQQQQQQQQQQ